MNQLALPFTPSQIVWTLTQPAQVNRSEWSLKRWVQPSGRGQWSAAVRFPPVSGEPDARRWRAFVTALQGPANSFRLPTSPFAQSPYGGAVTAAVSGQTGGSFSVTGLPPGATLLQAGDHITVQDALYQLTQDLTGDGAGAGTAHVLPFLRAPTVAAQPVIVTAPYALMALAASSVSWSQNAGQVYDDMTLDCEEVI